MHAHRPAGCLSGDHIAMIAKGVSTIVASCDAGLRPSIMRAVASTVTPDGGGITVYLMRPQSAQLLQDISASGRLAVVFSEPSTHRTLQVKAAAVQTRPAIEADLPVLRRYLESMERELGLIGFGPDFARAMLAQRPQDVVALQFAPQQAFDQTPGPRAGTALAAPVARTRCRPAPSPGRPRCRFRRRRGSRWGRSGPAWRARSRP